MALSTGLKHTLSEAGSWLIAAGLMIGGVVYFDVIKQGIVDVVGIELPQAPEQQAQNTASIEDRLREAEERTRQAEAKAQAAEASARAHARSAQSSRQQLQAQANRPVPGGAVELKARRHGHFIAETYINGRAIEGMIDTGASIVALTYEDAERIGIYVSPGDFTHRVSTANGTAKVAPVKLDRVEIGHITVRNVQAVVSEPGRLNSTLIGMSFLGRLSRTEISNGTLILQE